MLFCSNLDSQYPLMFKVLNKLLLLLTLYAKKHSYLLRLTLSTISGVAILGNAEHDCKVSPGSALKSNYIVSSSPLHVLN